MARQHLKTTLEPPRPVVHTTGPAQRSKLSRAHFAFLRGWFQGLDEKALWNLYLTQAGSFDVRRCRALLKDLQAELGAVARRAGRPALAGLLRRKGCRRRSNIDPPCRSNIDPGVDAGRMTANCG